MEKLAKLGWQKLIIIAAALDIVLGIIFGAIFKAVPAGNHRWRAGCGCHGR